jgi:hypothetical protein
MVVDDSEIDVTSESDAHIHVHGKICMPFARGRTSFDELSVIVIEILDFTTFLRRLVCVPVSMSVQTGRWSLDPP